MIVRSGSFDMRSFYQRPETILASLWWLVIVFAGSRPAAAERNLGVGDPIPAFSLARADGKPGAYTSEQLKGRAAVIIFWRPHQTLSQDALRDVEAVARELGADKIHIAAVDALRSSAPEIQAALAGETFSFPMLLDPQRDLYTKMG